ncbi:MAG: 30S ribosomal protein S2 [Candidatus Aenigmarchaeota archaeon]|nr:30S ribosomal protein S2 [Candidatus Aenigmarchaeota archaeon]
MAFENLLSTGMHIGMKQQNAKMKKFIYKTREDGLAILDLQTIDNRIKIAAKFLSKYDKIMVATRKPIAYKAIKKFAEITQSKAVAGRFLPGIITNPSFRGYYEPQVLIIVDPSTDFQAIDEAIKMRIPIISLADTYNELGGIDFAIPVNNKGRRAVAMVFYLLAKELLKEKGIIKEDSEYTEKVEDFESTERVEER